MYVQGASASVLRHEAHALPDSTQVQPVETYANTIAVRSAVEKVTVVSELQLQVVPRSNGEFNKAGDLAEARAGGLPSAGKSAPKSDEAPPCDPASRFCVRQGDFLTRCG